MEKITDKKKIGELVLLFTFLYFTSYITRINYGAVISEMEKTTEMTRTMLSMALTGSFITYGAGQIVSGICGDRFSPKRLITYGLCLTVLMNVLIPFCPNAYIMLGVWCVNGFAQAFMWPPLVKLMTTLLTEEDYKASSVKVSWGSSFGTIAVYLLSPVIIALSGWKAVFFVSAICGIVMILVWNRFCIDIEVKPNTAVKSVKETNVAKPRHMLFNPLMICVMLAIVLQGMLRDGVTTWMPSYISETYDLSNIVAILTGVVMPIFSILTFQVTSRLYRKVLTNPMTCAGVIFGVGAIASLALVFFTGKNAALSVAFSALLTGSMHGVNLILICMVPAFFNKYGNVSTVSGILNSCTYVGSAISTYGIALISEKFSWSFTLLIWLIIALFGTLLCLVNIIPWRKKMS